MHHALPFLMAAALISCGAGLPVRDESSIASEQISTDVPRTRIRRPNWLKACLAR